FYIWIVRRVCTGFFALSLRDALPILGVQLFERSRRHVALTTDGEALLPYARRLVALADDAHEEFAERSGLRRGRVRLGTTPTLGGHLLPRAMRGFFQTYPGLEITQIGRAH